MPSLAVCSSSACSLESISILQPVVCPLYKGTNAVSTSLVGLSQRSIVVELSSPSSSSSSGKGESTFVLLLLKFEFDYFGRNIVSQDYGITKANVMP